MADSETSGGRRRREEEQNVGSYGKDLMDLIANKNPEPEAPNLRPNAQPWIPMQREEEEDGGSISSGLNNDSPWEQIVAPVPVPEPEPEPEPQPQPQPEPAPVIDTGRLGANLNIEIPTLSETQSPVESVVPTATPTVTEPQTTSQPRRRGEERAEATMLAPVTQPVTTPSQENTTPVTRPSRHSKTTSSVSEQNEQAPTPSSTYQEWMNYLAQQEAAQQAGNTQNSQFAPQQDVSVLGNGYVQPVTLAPRNYMSNYQYNPALTEQLLGPAHDYTSDYQYNPNLTPESLANNTPVNNFFRERNDILSTIAGNVGNGVSDWFSGLQNGISRRNDIIGNAMADIQFPNVSQGVADRNALLGNVINTSYNDASRGIEERNALLPQVLQNVGDRIVDGVPRGDNVPPSYNPNDIRLNPPIMSGDPMAEYASLFEPQTTQETPVLTLEDPQWLQDLTGGNSLAGVAANALDSILRIGSGGPVQPVTEDPLAPVGDWLLGQMIGEENVAPAVALGNSIAQNPVVSEAAREIGDFLLDQQLGKANADELRSRFGIETTPTTIMNQPQSTAPDSVRFAEEAAARRNNAGSSAPQSPAPQATAPINTSGSQPTVFDSIGNWFSSQFGNNNAAGSSTPQTTAPATTPSTTPSTAAPQTAGSQGGDLTINPETGRPMLSPENRMTREEYMDYARDAVSDERYFDDLMQMAAPGFDANGKLNTAAEALFVGTDPSDPNYAVNGRQLTNEQRLHLFDRGGSFADPNSGININDAFSDLIADNPSRAIGNPDMAQWVNLTPEQYTEQFTEFLRANPIMQELGARNILTAEEMMNNFFKGVPSANDGGGSGLGTGSGGSSGKVSDGFLTLPASYGQSSGKVVKAPYRKGGYSEAELKAMGNSPYTTNRGYTGYEGYYYNVYDKKWYPVDQNKANYYNRYGTYNGYTQDKADYYNTFGTYNGYRQGWKSAGRSGGGGGSRGGGGGYSSSRSSYSGASYQTPTTTPRRAQSSTNGYYYGNNYNYQQPVTPNAVKQQDQRINNIMKNWTF